MPNILFNMWVKIVNNLRMTRCISCGRSSTIRLAWLYKNITHCVKIAFMNPHLPQSSTTINTPKLSTSNLLNKSFTYFPQDLLIRPIN